MTAQEYQALSDQLSSIAPMIPQRWGRIQNDRTDASIHLFAYKDFEALERAIKTLPPESAIISGKDGLSGVAHSATNICFTGRKEYAAILKAKTRPGTWNFAAGRNGDLT